MTTKFFGIMEYQISPSRIQCGADRDGCRVFEIGGLMGVLKVLALDQAEAELAYREELEDDPEWCSECGCYMGCICEPEDEED